MKLMKKLNDLSNINSPLQEARAARTIRHTSALIIASLASLLTGLAGAAPEPAPGLSRSANLEQRLDPAGGGPGDNIGSVVAMRGDFLLIGAPGDSTQGNASGAVHAYRRINGVWTFTETIIAPAGQTGDRFGDAVDLRGTRAIIGATQGDGVGADTGLAYIYEFNAGSWNFAATLSASDGAAADRFGSAVSVDGNRAVVGADSDDDLGGQSGSAYVFELINGTWFEQTKLTASDGDAIANFGLSLSLDGDRLLVGAPGDDQISLISGAGYLFELDQGRWSERQKLLASNGALGDGLGISASLDGDRLVLGAPGNGGTGAAFVYEFDGIDWVETMRLSGSDLLGGELFGESLALQGDEIVVGAPDGNGLVNRSGSAYRFVFGGATWSQAQKLAASDGAQSDRFGSGVALDRGRFLVGADNEDAAGAAAGTAYLFQEATDLVLNLIAPPAAQAGINLNYQLQVLNQGSNTAYATVLDHTLTPNLILNSVSAPCASGFPCDLGELAAGASLTLDLSAQVPANLSGQIVLDAQLNTLTVESNAGDETANTTLNVLVEADLRVSQSGPAVATAGSALNYQILVENLGPADADSVSLNAITSAGLSFTSASAPCAAGFPCNLGALVAGGSVMIDAVFTADAGFSGTVSNTASVSSGVGDPVPANNSDRVDTAVDVVADLSVQKNGPTNLIAGTAVQYQITVDNLSALDAPGVSLSDPTPSGLSFISASAPCQAGFPCDLGVLAASGSVQIDVSYAVAADLSGIVTNTATVSTLATDPVPANDEASTQGTVLQQADLSLAVLNAINPVAGAGLTLDLEVMNLGPSQANNVILDLDALAGAGINAISAPCAGGFPCALSNLAPGAGLQISIDFSVDSNQLDPLQIQFSVASDVSDTSPANNSVNLNPAVAIVHDLVMVDKLDGTLHFEAGDTTQYVLIVSNEGPSAARSVRIQDLLPPQLINAQWQCVTIEDASCQTTTGTGDVDVLADFAAPGSLMILLDATVIDTVNEGDSITNRASVSVGASGSDPVGKNNTADDRNVIGLFADGFEDGY